MTFTSVSFPRHQRPLSQYMESRPLPRPGLNVTSSIYLRWTTFHFSEHIVQSSDLDCNALPRSPLYPSNLISSPFLQRRTREASTTTFELFLLDTRSHNRRLTLARELCELNMEDFRRSESRISSLTFAESVTASCSRTYSRTSRS